MVKNWMRVNSNTTMRGPTEYKSDRECCIYSFAPGLRGLIILLSAHRLSTRDQIHPRDLVTGAPWYSHGVLPVATTSVQLQWNNSGCREVEEVSLPHLRNKPPVHR